MNTKKYNEMKNVDVRTVDKSELVDIGNVKININDKPEKKMQDYIEQVKNPYCFLCNGYAVKLAFANNNRTIEDCFTEAIGALIWFCASWQNLFYGWTQDALYVIIQIDF